MVQVIDAVCADVQRGQNIYNKLFYRWFFLLKPTVCAMYFMKYNQVFKGCEDLVHNQRLILCCCLVVGLMSFCFLLLQCCESRLLQHIIQAAGKTGKSLKQGENVFWSLCKSCCDVVVAKFDSASFQFSLLAGSRWCKCSNGAGLWHSGARELQTDSDYGGNHLRTLHVFEDPQGLPRVSSPQVCSALMTIHMPASSFD